MDKLELFTQNKLNYDKINNIYNRCVRVRNDEETVHPLPKISLGFDDFLQVFTQQLKKMENFCDDARLFHEAFVVCILFNFELLIFGLIFNKVQLLCSKVRFRLNKQCLLLTTTHFQSLSKMKRLLTFFSSINRFIWN